MSRCHDGGIRTIGTSHLVTNVRVSRYALLRWEESC